MRLIDADALDMYECLRSYYGDTWRDAQKAIDDAPTVDAVKHGHWISVDDDGDSPYECSVCGGVKVNENGEWLDICHSEWSKMPYCAVCGAKMDEEAT
jgi:hypothetical protein